MARSRSGSRPRTPAGVGKAVWTGEGGEVVKEQKYVLLAVAVAVLAVIAGVATFNAMSDPHNHNHNHNHNHGPFSSSTDSGGPTDQSQAPVLGEAEAKAVRDALKRGERLMGAVEPGQWNYTTLRTVGDAREYLLRHPRVSQHVAAFSRAVFEINEVSTEDLGYTYIVCAAGGPIVFDDFQGGNLAVKQTVSSDRRRLTRKLVYDTTVHSVLDEGVVERCGASLEMQPPAPMLPLPYTDNFHVVVGVTETWASSVAPSDLPAASEPDSSNSVSIEPLSQWTPTGIAFDVTFDGQRSYSHWDQQLGAAELETVFGPHRWRQLTTTGTLSGERLVGEASARCNFTVPGQAQRCLHPLTLFHGSPPLISSSIFLEWQQFTWAEDHVAPDDEDIAINVDSTVAKAPRA